MSRLLLSILCLFVFLICSPAVADQRSDPREQALSDALDLWREGRYEQLYERLARRSSMSREQFDERMRDAAVRPACCYQKLTGFRVISEHRTTSKVFARIGMEGGPGPDAVQSREFVLDHEEGRWKVRLSDIRSMAALSRAKKKKK